VPKQETSECRTRAALSGVVQRTVWNHHSELSTRREELEGALDNDKLAAYLVTATRSLEVGKRPIAETVAISLSDLITKGWVTHNDSKTRPVRTQGRVGEHTVEAAPLGLNVSVPILVDQQIGLADSTKYLVDLDAEKVMQGKFCLDPFSLGLASVKFIDAVPDL
jgi:hypothetical protein